MSAAWFIILIALLFGVFAVLTSPWRRAVTKRSVQASERLRNATADVLSLEAARDSKYREIRDAELDRQTGKLSEADFTLTNDTLRAEAVTILRELDRAQTRVEKLRKAEAEQRVAAGIELDPEVEADADEDPEPAPARGPSHRGPAEPTGE